jgi:hypothetical protein
MAGVRAGEFPQFFVELALTPDPFAAYLDTAFTYGDAATTNDYLYVDMSSIADYAIQAGDVFEYDVYVPSTNAAGAGVGGMDVESATQAGRSFGSIADAYGAINNPTIPRDQWIHRALPLAAMIGQTIILWELVAEQDRAAAGTATARYRDIYISDGAGSIRRNVWRQDDQVPTYGVAYSAPAGGTFAGPKAADPPVWTDITAYVRGFAITDFGRQHELDVIQPASASVRLNNRDRRFDPTYAAGPYYPNLTPLRRMRIRAVWQGQTYYRYDGHVLGWPRERHGPREAQSEVQLVDAFEALSQALLYTQGAVWPQELSGARVNRVLDAIGYPSADRIVDAGNSTIQGMLIAYADKINALEHLQDVEDAELGLFYIDGLRRAIFRDRSYRSAFQASVLATFGDAAPANGELPYKDLSLSYDRDQIRNEVVVQPANHTDAQVATDYASRARYGRRTESRTPLLFSDNEAADMSYYLLGRYKDPALRVESIDLDGRMGNAVVTQILARSLGDRIKVVQRPPPAGSSAISQESHIENMKLDVGLEGDKKSIKATWQLSPADTQSFWVLDSTVNSVLGVSTRPGF